MLGNITDSSDQDFMDLAFKEAEKSNCLRPKKGAVLVKDGQVIAGGHSGSIKGLKSCLEVGCIRDQLNIPSGRDDQICRSVCAEQRVVFGALIKGISPVGAVVYSTHFPCAVCSRIMIYLGVGKIVYKKDYDDEFSRLILDEAGVETVKI